MRDKEDNSSSLKDDLEYFNNSNNANNETPESGSDEKDKNINREISYILPKGGQTREVEMENVGNLCDDKLKNFNKKDNKNEKNETHISNNTNKNNNTNNIIDICDNNSRSEVLSLSESNSQNNNSLEENIFSETNKNKFQEKKILPIRILEGKAYLFDEKMGSLREYNQKKLDKKFKESFCNNNQSKEDDDDLSQSLYFMDKKIVPFNFNTFQQNPNNNINSKEIHQFLSLKIIVNKYGKYFKKLYPKIFKNKDELAFLHSRNNSSLAYINLVETIKCKK